MARPKKEIDWDRVGKLLQSQCMATGIAEMLGISVDTLYIRCKQDNGIDFSAFSQQKKAEGQELLRAKQFQVAMSGDKVMLIWLGKQYLGQKDKSDVDLKTDTKPLREEIAENFNKLFPPIEK